MNKFKIAQVKLSKKSDIKIRIKLFMAQVKKSIDFLSILKIATPVFVFGLISLGVFNMINTDLTTTNTEQTTQTQHRLSYFKNTKVISKLKQIRNIKYKTRANKRLNTRKITYYKKYSQLRPTQLRYK